jgi:DUF1680 family protein
MVSDVVMPSDALFEERKGEGVFGGMVMLSTPALRLEVGGGPQRELYREPRGHAVKRQDATLIPSFAGNNRGLSEMSTWLPVRWA